MTYHYMASTVNIHTYTCVYIYVYIYIYVYAYMYREREREREREESCEDARGLKAKAIVNWLSRPTIFVVCFKPDSGI